MAVTPLFQEALVEAQKLREVATAEAKNAVLEAVSPLIKQMIDREIAGLIMEQEEPPPIPSPDAGATGPVDVAPPVGAEVAPPPMPTAPPAVAAASPPIATMGGSVLGKIEASPTGEQQIVIPIDALFQGPTSPDNSSPVSPPAPPTDVAAPTENPAPVVPPPEEQAPLPAPLSEIYAAVQKFLREQAAPPAPVAPIDPAAVTPPAPAPVAPAPPVPAAPVAPAPVVDPKNAAPAAPLAPVPPAPITPTPVAAAPVVEYKVYKEHVERAEQSIGVLRRKENRGKAQLVKEEYEKLLFSLYENLTTLRENNAISPRLFSFNEDRLGLLYENLNILSSYTPNPMEKDTHMKNRNSVKELIKSLLEGAEGFENPVGKVNPAGDSKGIDDGHAKKASGNPKNVDAKSEKTVPTKQKNTKWEEASASSESLLEQLEAEINELVGEMGESETDPEEVVLELSDEEVVQEAKKARARIKALKEQAEEEIEVPADAGVETAEDLPSADDGGSDNLSLNIELSGVSGADVENVNVSVDGEELDVDMGDEAEEEAPAELPAGDDEIPPELQEAKKLLIRTARKIGAENKTLRGQLQETEQLAARSIYVNKLFVRDDLSGAQKRKIVEYLDRARTIAEAKEIYNQVTRVLNSGKKAGLVKESVEKQTLNESVEFGFDTDRWQILAGMKKSAK